MTERESAEVVWYPLPRVGDEPELTLAGDGSIFPYRSVPLARALPDLAGGGRARELDAGSPGNGRNEPCAGSRGL